MAERAVLRIGEVAKRTGVTVATLRAWERRYDLLDPERTGGGHRLYSEADVERVRSMQGYLDDGWSASAAAEEVRTRTTVHRLQSVPNTGSDVSSPDSAPSSSPSDRWVDDLKQAFDDFDTVATNRVLDDVLARLDVPMALEEIVFPVLRWVGDGWQDDPRVIAREHFASNAMRPRLLRMIRSTGSSRRSMVAACPPDEDHDLGLLGASAVLSTSGWAVRYLGARTPTIAVEQSARDANASVVLLSAVHPDHAASTLERLPDVGDALLVLGGNGFSGYTAPAGTALLSQTSLRNLPEAIERALRDHDAAGQFTA